MAGGVAAPGKAHVAGGTRTGKTTLLSAICNFLPLGWRIVKIEDPEEIWRCKRRIAELTPMLTQMTELAELTAHYYDRSYYRDERFTV